MLKEAILALSTAISPVEAECLALNAYFEARNQSDAGMIAVSHVVLNRVASDRFPNTLCDAPGRSSILSTKINKKVDL
jgi:spore germination cell wall hydrolase CwlJ-like protein